MHFRTAEPKDIPALLQLYLNVAQLGNFARTVEEISVGYVQDFVSRSLQEGLIIVAENPDQPNELVGEIHATKPDSGSSKHVLRDLTIAVHPSFQQKGLGKTMLRIFLEEVMHHRQDVGKVELVVNESNANALKLFQSFEFLIEGRLEMHRRNPDKSYEAEIPMGWQNPTFEFDQ